MTTTTNPKQINLDQGEAGQALEQFYKEQIRQQVILLVDQATGEEYNKAIAEIGGKEAFINLWVEETWNEIKDNDGIELKATLKNKGGSDNIF